MSQPFVGEIRLFAGNFAPAGWAFCDGSILAIAENDTLFTLIGTTYGGDGQVTFALPDLRGRIPLHQGQGPALSPRPLSTSAGTETVTLLTTQMPTHTHAPAASSRLGTSTSPAGAVWAATSSGAVYASGPPGPGTMAANAIGLASGNRQPHENVMPFQAVSFIISLFGIFPSQG